MKRSLLVSLSLLTIAVTILSACSPTGLSGGAGGGGNEKITICHATGSATNPYVEITVSINAANGTKKDDTGADHQSHPDDIIPAPDGGCPKPTEPPAPPTEPPAPEKITICHATGSTTNPYVEITVSKNSTDYEGHAGHSGDIIPAPAGGCPAGVTDTPEPKKISLCHATGSETNPYVEITVSINAASGTTGHEGHPDDIIPMPAGGCPKPEVKKVTLCHATGSATNPYVEITVSINAADGTNGHEGHPDDIIPMPAGGCPVSLTEVPTNTPTVTPIVQPTKIRRTRGPQETPTNTPVPPTLVSTDTPTPTNTPVPPPPPITITVEPGVQQLCQEFIVFHTFRDQNLEIYRLDGVEGANNAKLLNLTNSGAMDSRPSRSPNDTAIVFQSNRNNNVELYTTDASGLTLKRLTNSYSNNVNAMFGPDNKTIIFQSDRNGNSDLFTIDSTSGVEKRLTTNPYEDVNPFYSPDLRWVVFQTNRNGNWDLFLLNTETGTEYGLVATSADEVAPAWSPNGKQIAYLSNASGSWTLHIVDFNGENDTVIGNGETTNATWSPEGYRIAYQSERDGNIDIYSYDLNSKKEYRVTTFAGADSAPTWNCGGSLISYTTTQNNNPDIFQVTWQGGSPTALTTSPATDKWSEWSPSKEAGSRGQ